MPVPFDNGGYTQRDNWNERGAPGIRARHASADIPGDIAEVRDRTRRIETRLTKWLESIGFETHAQKPLWFGPDDQVAVSDAFVELPSLYVSIKDILESIPPGYIETIEDVCIVHAGRIVAVLTAPMLADGRHYGQEVGGHHYGQEVGEDDYRPPEPSDD
jgi:hypothetical protein